MKQQPSLRTASFLLGAALLTGCGGGGGAGPMSVARSTQTAAGPAGGGTANSYTVSGTVAGLTGTVVLELNGATDVSVAANGAFSFPGTLISGEAYTVTVKTQPAVTRELCAVSNGAGAIGAENIDNIAVQCALSVAFLYQTVVGQADLLTQSNQILSYGVASGTGALMPFGSGLPVSSQPRGIAVSPGGGFLYVGGIGAGTYISIFAVDPVSGALSPRGQVALAGQDGWKLVMSPAGFLFVLGNDLSGAPGADMAMVTYRADPTTGALTLTGSSLTFPTPGVSDYRANIALTSDGRFLYTLFGAYDTNSPPVTVTAYAVDPATGALAETAATLTPGVNTPTMALDSHNRFLYLVSDQGSPMLAATTVLPYAINPANGALTPVGSGTAVPSNGYALVADPLGRYLYIANSLNLNAANDTVLALGLDQTSGAVSIAGTPVLTSGTPVQVVCDPSGQFIFVGTYVGSSTSPSLAAFAVSGDPAATQPLAPAGAPVAPGYLTEDLAIIE